MPVNAETGKAYRGINVVSLWVAAEATGYSTPPLGHLRLAVLVAPWRKRASTSIAVYRRQAQQSDGVTDGMGFSLGKILR
jgi:antirestriction protein ArdC